MAPETERGRYRYLRNGEDTRIEEFYSVRGPYTGDCQISSWRRAPGVLIEVDATLEQGRVNTFDVSWHGDGSPQLHANYRLCETGIQVWHRAGDREPQMQALPVASDVTPLLSPLMRIFVGPVIARLLDQGGAGEVVVPFIGKPDVIDDILKPQISLRQASLLDPVATLRRDGQSLTCRLCEYTGDQYVPGTRFYLDDDDRLLRYQWQQDEATEWDVWMAPVQA
jgi:hypothetical protein